MIIKTHSIFTKVDCSVRHISCSVKHIPSLQNSIVQ